MPGYDGASLARRLSPWIPNRNHINTVLAAEGPMLRARTRQLIANNGYGANASETFTSYATGTGIVPSPTIDNEGLKKRVKDAWLAWTDEADADGLTDFYGLQSLAARALFDAGEVFIRRRDRFAADGLTVPFQLQLLEAEQLDSGYTVLQGPNGNIIRSGIEFDAIGKRQAYWFWRYHPGDGTQALTQGMVRVRVPAEQVLHLFKPLRPGQIRGRPWMTAAMVKMYDLDRYEDAELVRKQGAAMFMAFIEQEHGEDIGNTGLIDDGTEADSTGTAEVDLEPGLAHLLPQGHKVHFNEPADVGPNYESFIYRNVLELCAAMGLPYFAVSGDTSRANYSSMRSALLEVKRRIEQFQHETLIFQMCRPIWNWFMPAAVLSGAIRLPGFAANPKPLMKVRWITPKWDWVDPLKDMQAEKLAVDAGFKSRSSVIESLGEDPTDVDNEIAADQAREQRLGLAFPVGKQVQATATQDPSDPNAPGEGDTPEATPAATPAATGGRNGPRPNQAAA
jgi:lambda family phage portal protein